MMQNVIEFPLLSFYYRKQALTAVTISYRLEDEMLLVKSGEYQLFVLQDIID